MAKFTKGVSGNPNGRPKRGETMAELLRAHLAVPVELESGETITRKQSLINRLFTIATIADPKDSLTAIKIIFEYTDGKPTQPITQEGAQTIRIEYATNDNSDTSEAA
jgi:hypothetical protein